MSSHFASSHNGGSHFTSSHYGRAAIVVIVPGGGITDAVEYTVLRPRRQREREELEILILMVSVIEQDRHN